MSVRGHSSEKTASALTEPSQTMRMARKRHPIGSPSEFTWIGYLLGVFFSTRRCQAPVSRSVQSVAHTPISASSGTIGSTLLKIRPRSRAGGQGYGLLERLASMR